MAVGGFGESEAGQQFARAIAGRLREREFVVVADPAAADVVVSGQVTMTHVEQWRPGGIIFGGGYTKGPVPMVSVGAERRGEILWQRLYEATRPKPLDDFAREAADHLADACRRQWRP